MDRLDFDVAHLFAGGLVLISFMLLYQDRLYALLNMFALQAVVLALSVSWQAHIQHAPHLYITAVITIAFKAIVIPVALHHIVARLGIHRDVENVVSVVPTMLAARIFLMSCMAAAAFPIEWRRRHSPLKGELQGPGPARDPGLVDYRLFAPAFTAAASGPVP